MFIIFISSSPGGHASGSVVCVLSKLELFLMTASSCFCDEIGSSGFTRIFHPVCAISLIVFAFPAGSFVARNVGL